MRISWSNSNCVVHGFWPFAVYWTASGFWGIIIMNVQIEFGSLEEVCKTNF